MVAAIGSTMARIGLMVRIDFADAGTIGHHGVVAAVAAAAAADSGRSIAGTFPSFPVSVTPDTDVGDEDDDDAIAT
jgi:hypothetical protein